MSILSILNRRLHFGSKNKLLLYYGANAIINTEFGFKHFNLEETLPADEHIFVNGYMFIGMIALRITLPNC